MTGGNTTVYIFSGSKVVAEYDNGAAPGPPSREYIYSGSALLAKIDSTGTHYYHQDHLSNRLVTDSSGNDYAELGTFPYGESWYNASGDKLQFTTYERDSESGNDYAQARSYVNRLARFSSLDPLAGDTSDPQTLNRYSYVRNMPVMFADPSGACPATVENIPDGFVEGHGSFVFVRFLESDPDADADADPDPQNPSQSCNPDNMNAVGGTWTLDGFDITSPTGSFPLGTSGTGAAQAISAIEAALSPVGTLWGWNGESYHYISTVYGFDLGLYGILPMLGAVGPGAGNWEQLPIQPRPMNNLLMTPPLCDPSGSAPTPSQYAALGQSVNTLLNSANAEADPENTLTLAAEQQNAINLASFRRGGSLDAQVRYGGSTAYANYAFGVYMSAAGFTLAEALTGANAYGSLRSHYTFGPNLPQDSNYPAIPASNVANIIAGYNAQQNGTLCIPR